MRAPVSWLRELADVPTDATGADVAAALVRVGLEEEGVHGGDLRGPARRGRVLSVEAEPQKNGKTIHWCTVDVGQHGQTVSEGKHGIVCGAHNFAVGDLVVVRPARRGAARRLRDLGAQDLRPRLRRHDLLGTRAGAR